jgi:histidinol-phosphate aminotransferase
MNYRKMEEHKLHAIIKLSQNENPLGPSPRVLETVREAGEIIHRYPEPHSRSLKKMLADNLNLPTGRVLVSAGLVESLDIVIRNFVGDEGNMIIGEITFVAYRLLSEVYGIKTKFSRLKDYRMDVDDILRLSDENTKLIIIANPNNPTGSVINENELIRLLEGVSSDTYVVLDEAYGEYVTQEDFPDSLNLLNRYPNLIVMRTFSKIYGLAGLRVGYSIASEEIIELMQHFQAPFTVNHLASRAAMAALDDQDYVRMCCKVNNENRIQLTRELTNLGIKVTPSQSNFLFLTFLSVEERNRVYDILGDNGVLVRKMDLFGADHSFRLTIGKTADNSRIISILKAADPSAFTQARVATHQ